MQIESPAAGADMVELQAAHEALASGEPMAALDEARRLISVSAPLREKWAAVVQFSAQLDDDDAALAAARRLWDETPKSVETAFILARTLEATGRAAEAIGLLMPAVAAGQLAVMELYRLSRMLMFAGRLAEARSLVERLLHEEPDNASLWERLAQLKRFAPADPDLDRLRQLQHTLAGEAYGPRAAAAWALAKALVDCGDDTAANETLEFAAALRCEAVRFDADSIEASMLGSLDAVAAHELRGDDVASTDGERVIFILGPPRSGTTLVEQILSRHSRISGGGELKFLALMRHELGNFGRDAIQLYLDRAGQRGFDPWLNVRQRYFALADDRFGKGSVFTDKLLSNHLRLAVIRKAFPAARIVRCRRDALDVAWSCWRANFTPDMIWQSAPDWIARYIGAYERILDVWSERFPGWIVNVDYEDLVRDPEWEIPRLLESCGLPNEAAAQRPHESDRTVMTFSFAQVREPISDRQIGSWRAFPRCVRGLQSALDAHGLRYADYV